MRTTLIVTTLMFIFTTHLSFAAGDEIGSLNLNPHKSQFFERLYLPVQTENKRILQQRQVVEKAFSQWKEQHAIDRSLQRTLGSILKDYELSTLVLNKEQNWQTLLSRVDTVPVSLVLAQAANESAWGQSRFARDGNNFFGQWCFSKGCGLVPCKRPKGASYEVRSFPSATLSIRSYLHNINTNQAYQLLRELRAKDRHAHQKVTGVNLAYGLVNYSTKRHSYVKDIQMMIKSNHLDRLDQKYSSLT